MFLLDSQGFSIPMAFVDLIPVILFFISGIILLNDLYNKLVKGNYALLATGVSMIFLAGLLKAIHKILAGAGVCDFTALNKSFFPMQSFGFVFLGAALLGLFYTKRHHEEKTLVVVPFLFIPILTELIEYNSSMPFVIIQVLGATVFYFMIFYIGLKMKSISSMILTILAFVTMLCMGYLSSKFSDGDLAKLNWIAEVVNIVSQGALLGSVFILHKKGLNNFIFKKRGDIEWKYY